MNNAMLLTTTVRSVTLNDYPAGTATVTLKGSAEGGDYTVTFQVPQVTAPRFMVGASVNLTIEVG